MRKDDSTKLNPAQRVLILGCGYVGTAAARLAREKGLSVEVHARSDAHTAALRHEGFVVHQRAVLDASVAELVDQKTFVVVAFPPDGTTDAQVAPALQGACATTYVSSTGVYGGHRGVVDDTTPIPSDPPPNERAAKILAAEDAYRGVGATILRCPGIYGRDRGLHVRVIKGEHRIPGDGSRYLSRIHVDDLAQFILASRSRAGTSAADGGGGTFVVGDAEPAPHIDVVRFIATAHGVPLPPFVPLESVHESLRADRRVDAARALRAFGVTLRFPTYREGMRREPT